MTIIKHELKMNFKSLLIWTLSVGLMSFVFVLMFPGLKTTLLDMADAYSNMGGFSTAFGMDKLNLGELMGFYGTEIGVIFTLGSSLFAALLGIGILSKEEGGHTSEFLFSLPISRKQVVLEKLLSILFILFLYNLAFILLMVLGFAFIGEDVDVKGFILFHLASFLMCIKISCICFALSSFSKKAALGSGLSVALLLYFADLMAKIIEDTKFLRYITPFSYADAADIIATGSIHSDYLIPGIIITIASTITGFIVYMKKDLAA